MALTSGAKKLGLTVILAAAIVGGGLYFQKHKAKNVVNVDVPAVTTPAQAPSAPVATEPAPAVPVAQEASPIKKQHVAKATVRKKSHGTASHQGGSSEPTHDTLHKELTSDQKALQGLAGDKL